MKFVTSDPPISLDLFIFGNFFTDSTMINQHQTTIWDEIFRYFDFFPSIKHAKIHPNSLPVVGFCQVDFSDDVMTHNGTTVALPSVAVGRGGFYLKLEAYPP